MKEIKKIAPYDYTRLQQLNENLKNTEDTLDKIKKEFLSLCFDISIKYGDPDGEFANNFEYLIIVKKGREI